MKKLVVLSVAIQILFFTKLAFGSQLVIQSYNHSGISLEVDGKYFGNVGHEFTFNNMMPGLHKIKVYKYQYNGYTQMNMLVSSKMIKVPVNSFVVAKIDRFNKIFVSEVLPMGSTPSNGLIINTGINTPPPSCGFGMSQNQFFSLKDIIARQSFDSSKLKIAKQAIQANGATSQQVFELMNLLVFESNKLKLAKFAYPFVVDKDNYFIVNNAFSFSSSTNSLYNFLNLY